MLSPGQVGLLNGWGVFSTIRVKDGVLFAWERHYERMRIDAGRMSVPFPSDRDALQADLLQLVEANAARDATLRVAVVRNRGGMFDAPNLDRDYDVIAFTKDLADWGSGVRLTVKRDARFSRCEFSGAKILSWSMNLTWLDQARRAGFDEMLLLNELGNVAECTSANLFLARGKQVYTPPLSAGCLAGVTRAILVEEIRVPGIVIEEHDFALDELERADDVFITSSTRDLLGVVAVDGKPMSNQDTVRRALNAAFGRYLDEYVARARQHALARAR